MRVFPRGSESFDGFIDSHKSHRQMTIKYRIEKEAFQMSLGKLFLEETGGSQSRLVHQGTRKGAGLAGLGRRGVRGGREVRTVGTRSLAPIKLCTFDSSGM